MSQETMVHDNIIQPVEFENNEKSYWTGMEIKDKDNIYSVIKKKKVQLGYQKELYESSG